MKFRTQLLQIGIAGIVGVLAIGATSWYMQHAYSNALEVTERNSIALRNHVEGEMMHHALHGDVERALWASSEKNTAEMADVKRAVVAHGKRFRDRIADNKALTLHEAARKSLNEIDSSVNDYINMAEEQVNLAIDNLAAERTQFVKFETLFTDLERKMGIVSDKLQHASDADTALTRMHVSIATWIQAIVILLSAAASLLLAIRLSARVTNELGGEPSDALAAAKRIGLGDYASNSALDVTNKNSLLGQMNIMRAQLEISANIAVENSRVKQALDATSSNIMLADTNRNIVYMNKAVTSMLRGVESDLRKALPNFVVDKVLGSNMDIFHKNPAHQSHLLAKLQETYVGNIVVAGLSFRLIANPIFSDNGARLGSVVEWIDRTKEVAAEHELSRIMGAIDSATTNIMIADNDRKIIYLNKSVETMLRNAENDLRKALPHFSVDRVLGSNMDIFHKNPAHQMKLLENLTTTYVGNIVVGGRHFRLVANPIFSKDGSRIGSVVEWLDRTQEVGVESEVSDVVQSAAQGNFKARIPVEGKKDFFLSLATGLNSLMSTSDVGLGEVNRVLSAIAKGDLTERITADYSGTFGDLKNYCNQTTESLTEMMSEIREAAETIFTASSEISSGNSDLSSRTEQQAANLEETASSMEELTSTVKLNADNAKQANVLAEQASSVASDGGNLIQQVVVTMNAINESSQKIADIIGVIDGIAFQTNILALNAAVEAARAGDQGRGFAVVASEVRTLAQRSANAAKDIKALISDSVKKIESGNSLVGKSGDTMKDIVTSIKRVNDIMAEIAAASAEQSSGIEEISTAVTQMDEMTQQNAALVEQAAAAAESLQSQADQLTQRVGQFRLADDISAPITRVTKQHKLPTKSLQKTPAKSTKKLAAPNQDDEWESF